MLTMSDPRQPRARAALQAAPDPSAHRELVVPHDPNAGSLVAVRNVLIQSSLAELKAHGLYDRYAQEMPHDMLEQLSVAALSPGWIPVELAHRHYGACDALALDAAQFETIGKAVGDRVQSAVLIALAKKVREANYDLWLAVGPLQRMWPRVFQGGSAQVWKLGPKEMLIEERGYSLNCFDYYRRAHLAALTATYQALGSNTKVELMGYHPARDEMNVRVTWR